MSVTFAEVQANPKVRQLIDGANEVLRSMGYTEHGQRHASLVAKITGEVLANLDAPTREVELGKIAGYLHDIGNVINRVNHPISGANLAFTILNEMGMDVAEVAPVLGAIGNHEELLGGPISRLSAALIVADKSDVHRSRVQNTLMESFDIHDRVNYAVTSSHVTMENLDKTISLTLDIDQSEATVMEYFEIFLSRMVMCRKSAQMLGYRFRLVVNGVALE
ncbi:MAG: HD domain-containing protein [Fimbriimonas sp.]